MVAGFSWAFISIVIQIVNRKTARERFASAFLVKNTTANKFPTAYRHQVIGNFVDYAIVGPHHDVFRRYAPEEFDEMLRYKILVG